VAELSRHPGRGLAGDPAEADHVPRRVLDHGLHPSVAEQPMALGSDRRTTLDLSSAGDPAAPAWAWTTTVARSGSGSAPSAAEASITNASARRASV
jgi:hypothetical protein